jgi:hypothetical protein
MSDEAEGIEFGWLAPDRFMRSEERRRLRQLLRQQKSLSDQKWHTADDIRLTRQRSVKTSMQNGVHRIPSWRNFLRTC